MNIFSKISVLFLLLEVLVFSSCKKKQKFPNEPIIEFKNLEKISSDSAQIIVSFTDGDGDIGLTEADSLEPYLFNFFVKYFAKKNGVFVEKVLSPPFNFRIPSLNSSKKAKSLEGDIVIGLPSPYYFPSPTKDTILFEMYLMDRALNKSNIVRSNEIIVP